MEEQSRKHELEAADVPAAKKPRRHSTDATPSAIAELRWQHASYEAIAYLGVETDYEKPSQQLYQTPHAAAHRSTRTPLLTEPPIFCHIEIIEHLEKELKDNKEKPHLHHPDAVVRTIHLDHKMNEWLQETYEEFAVDMWDEADWAWNPEAADFYQGLAWSLFEDRAEDENHWWDKYFRDGCQPEERFGGRIVACERVMAGICSRWSVNLLAYMAVVLM